jgi:hypothetical protein
MPNPADACHILDQILTLSQLAGDGRHREAVLARWPSIGQRMASFGGIKWAIVAQAPSKFFVFQGMASRLSAIN